MIYGVTNWLHALESIFCQRQGNHFIVLFAGGLSKHWRQFAVPGDYSKDPLPACLRLFFLRQ
jgi:hypothetical protein